MVLITGMNHDDYDLDCNDNIWHHFLTTFDRLLYDRQSRSDKRLGTIRIQSPYLTGIHHHLLGIFYLA